MKTRPLWHVYVRLEVAIIPTVAQTTAGYFLDTEPVRVVSIDDRRVLAQAIAQTMSVGNPKIETPTRDAFPKPVVLAAVRVKTWGAFMREAICFTILRGETEIAIMETSRNKKGEWVDAPHLTHVVPAASPLLDLATWIAQRSMG